MVVLNKKNIIRNIMLVIGIIFAIVFSISLINDLELETITQWTVIVIIFYDSFPNYWSSTQDYSK
ncbi:MAG: hypothetical protein JW390_10104 [Nitrosopumilus sp.]|nr:hypothetical protein [Candidatus Nitrosopumilus limneticus]